MKYTTKPLTLKQRSECNDFVPVEMNPVQGTYTIKDAFKAMLRYLEYGLDTLNDIKITSENFDELVNQLSTDEIKEISDKIAEETNLTKKKKSKSD